MDKNTLLGLLMMGAVIFGFMWLNQPSEEELHAMMHHGCGGGCSCDSCGEGGCSGCGGGCC